MLTPIHRYLSRTLFTTTLLLILGSSAAAQFSTIINLPPDSAPATVGSGTQVNVLSGGALGSSFIAGQADGLGNDVEINVSGGEVADRMIAFGGTVVNVSAGTVAERLRGFVGSSVNLSGGSIGNEWQALSGSNVRVTGGTFGRFFRTQAGQVEPAVQPSNVEFIGSEFRINGDLINELTGVGSSLQVDLSVSDILSGTLADGTPFVLSGLFGDAVGAGSLTLRGTSLGSVGSNVIVFGSPTDFHGIRTGQTAEVSMFGSLADNFNAGRGSQLIVSGGSVGQTLEAVNAHVHLQSGALGDDFATYNQSVVDIEGGTIGEGFRVFAGSVVNQTGGTIGENFNVHDSSVTNIRGGTIQAGLNANPGSYVNISDGTVEGSVTVFEESHVNISGGEFLPEFRALVGSQVNISGGTFGDDFDANSGSSVNLYGRSFFLDGTEITSMLSGITPLNLTDRDKTLTGILADGSAFSFDLNSANSGGQDHFHPDANLNLILGLPGDFNGDGTVNAADYTVWRDNLGQSGQGSAGDGNADGSVDENDYALWKENFGRSRPRRGQLTESREIPEPSCIWLLMLSLTGASVRIRSRFLGQ